ncbi:MAG: tripartite tricarboxylate transporter TctB family protein [Sporomusa sp.]|jgi:hypothetical protein|nr:tripartite tricarboxylate transporter TctB family protein [Sporomusa sp.]
MTLDKVIISMHVVLAAVYLYGSSSLALGTLKSPGAGMFPLIIGSIWAVISLAAFSGQGQPASERLDKATSVRLTKVGAAIVLYLVLLPVIGFTVSTFLALYYVSHLMGNQGWGNKLRFSLTGVIVSVLIFQWLLQLPLPEPLLAIFDI